MFLRIDESKSINLFQVKTYRTTYDESPVWGIARWKLVFEFVNGTREIVKYDTVAQAKEAECNIRAWLDKKCFDLSSN